MTKTTPPKRGIRPAAIVVLFLTVALTGLLLALGTWQVKRLSWKLDLIERVEARVHAEPTDAPAAGHVDDGARNGGVPPPGSGRRSASQRSTNIAV